MRFTKIIAYALLASFVLVSFAMFVGCSSKEKTTQRYNKKEATTLNTSFSRQEVKDVKKDCTAFKTSLLKKQKTASDVAIKLVDPNKPGTAKKTENKDGSTLWELNNTSISEQSNTSEESEAVKDSIQNTVSDNSTNKEAGNLEINTENEAAGRNAKSDANRFPTSLIIAIAVLGVLYLINRKLKFI